MNNETKKILLIDDCEILHVLLENILHSGKEKYQIEHAYDGLNGYMKFKSFNPDLTFLDISMPLMSGYGCLKKIIKLKPEAKVVMLTALDQEEVQNKLKTIGAVDFLPKPFKPVKLLKMAQKYLSTNFS